MKVIVKKNCGTMLTYCYHFLLLKNASFSSFFIFLVHFSFISLDNTSYNWQEQEKEVCSSGLKFVPTIRRHNLANKYKDFLQFGRRLRLAVFFHRLEKENVVNENQIIRIVSEEIVHEEPWTKPSTFNPTAGQNEALESFLFELEKYLFDPKNSRKVNENLTQMQRRALKRLST